MFGFFDVLAGVRATVGVAAGVELESSEVSAAAAPIAAPTPASRPPAISPRFSAVRLSTRLCSSGSMLSMRAFILGAGATLGLALIGTSVAVAQTGPACAPAVLNNSALQDGAVTVSPLAGSRDANPQTQISFLGVPASDLSAISVVGARTGAHSGRLLAYSQGDGASFVPSRPFDEGELVTVRARVRVGGSVRALLDEFAIAHNDPITTTAETLEPLNLAGDQSFRSRPELHPPVVTVTASSPAVAAGDEFLAPYHGPGQSGPMILDPSGGLLWFKPMPANTEATNLQVQEYEGKPVLTWWQGKITHGFGMGEDVIADDTYTDIEHVHAGNGLEADLHELQLTPQGTALLTAYHPVLCDLSSVGGPSYGGLVDATFQEIDVRTGLVMYEWTTVDHVALSESYEHASRSSAPEPFDYFHMNSISVDRDGSLLISGRNTWTVYKLSPQSGQILWRLGGRHSSFKMGAGTGTAWQHDARELPDGSISVFDNGASPTVHSQSRAVVLSINPQSHTATLAGRWTHTPPLLSESEGSVEALANGDWFVGWGGEPYFSEFGPEGTLLFDAHLPVHTVSYRSFRFQWAGTPAHPPVFAFAPGGEAGGTAYASWNGATLVASWRALAGASPSSLTSVAEVPRSGFETAIAIPAGTVGPYLQVQALNAAGQVLGTSGAASESSLG
jgi:hypothetical protein